MKLVIVESPTKAKTIKRFLPKDYVVESSFGHIRDLPKSATEIPLKYKKESWARLGINIDAEFDPLYIIPKDKKKQVAKLKQLVKDADTIYLATDEDREGEAISWHLLEVLQPKVPVHRMVFHEITKSAIEQALKEPRELDMHLVEAQETRRIVDRLYGYEVSPVLWRKVAPKLSAGRVQSAALYLIVEREQERMAFTTAKYWDIIGTFTTSTQHTFTAKLLRWKDQRLASGKDFDQTGQLHNKNVVVLNQAEAEQLAKDFPALQWTVSSLEQKPVHLSPKAPFITSTLQQEAGSKLRWSAKQTMRVAQKLYEQGYITYMRTDSVQLSAEAITAARNRIEELYGKDYLASEPRSYKNKIKNAQEAHEAIRPAGTTMRTVAELGDGLTDDERMLYEFIWKRTMASQMVDAKLQQTTLQLTDNQSTALFQASGRIILFPGYLKAHNNKTDNETASDEELLPTIVVNDTLAGKEFLAEEHTTKSPARYTEASLVKELEIRGIGRPSTYATIIDTIQQRGYVYKNATALVPRFVAFGVVQLLQHHFSKLVNTTYTADMETDLDEVAAGNIKPLPYLQQFYFGNTAKHELGLREMLKVDIDARSVCTIPIGKTEDNKIINVRVGRYGPFVECIDTTGDSQTASIPTDLAPDELTVDQALNFIEKQAAGPTALGTDPVTQESVYVLEGRFGPYVQLGDKPPKPEKGSKKKVAKPKMKGLPKEVTPESITLDQALMLLSLPKVIGTYNKTNEDIVLDHGRFGSYIKSGIETRSLPITDSIFDFTLERAHELLNTPKQGGRRGPTKLKELGVHPATEKPIVIMNGRYGPYIKYQKINVSLPKESSPETFTLEAALELIAQKEN